MVKRTLSLTESVAFELDNLVTENNCDLETLILTNLSKAHNRRIMPVITARKGICTIAAWWMEFPNTRTTRDKIMEITKIRV